MPRNKYKTKRGEAVGYDCTKIENKRQQKSRRSSTHHRKQHEPFQELAGNCPGSAHLPKPIKDPTSPYIYGQHRDERKAYWWSAFQNRTQNRARTTRGIGTEGVYLPTTIPVKNQTNQPTNQIDRIESANHSTDPRSTPKSDQSCSPSLRPPVAP